MIERSAEPTVENGYTKSDIVDGKAYSKPGAMPSSRVLQEQHLVTDRNRTNLSQHSLHNTQSQRAGYYKENMLIPNYSQQQQPQGEHLIFDRHSSNSYIRGKLLGKVSLMILTQSVSSTPAITV